MDPWHEMIEIVFIRERKMCKDCLFSKYNKVLLHYSVSIAAAVAYIPLSAAAAVYISLSVAATAYIPVSGGGGVYPSVGGGGVYLSVSVGDGVCPCQWGRWRLSLCRRRRGVYPSVCGTTSLLYRLVIPCLFL